jgi:integrase
LLAALIAERETYQRLIAGITDGSAIDLSLVKLPASALLFPSPLGLDLTTPRDSDAVTRMFARRASRLGFCELRLHDLRGSHGLMLRNLFILVPTAWSGSKSDRALRETASSGRLRQDVM